MLSTKRLAGLALLSTVLVVLGLGPVGFTSLAPKFETPTQYRYRIQLDSRFNGRVAELSTWLQRHQYDVAGQDLHRGTIEVITTDVGIQLLEQKGLHGQVIAKKEAGERTDTLQFDSRYLSPDKVTEKLKALHAAFPNLTRLEQIGTSIQGRPIWAMLISTTPVANDPKALEKPSLILDGLHHAREIMTPEIVMDAAETILKATMSEAHARTFQIVNGWNIWVIPMLNVDGNNIVWTNNNWWRKNARSDKSSLYGVDLNRNYPYKWAACDGSSGGKSSDTYRGAAAASEPETQAFIRLAEAVEPTAYLSYHSYSELVLYPYGCEGDLSGENALNEKLAGELAQRLPTDRADGSFYTPGAPWKILYAVDGDSMDYVHAAFGSLSYTFEVNQEFQPSYDLREPTLKKHRVAWAYFINRANDNMLHLKVVDGKTGQPAQALINVNSIPHIKGERPFKTNAAGYYFKVLDPGTYGISATLADGRTAQVGVQMNGQPQDVTLTVQ